MSSVNVLNCEMVSANKVTQKLFNEIKNDWSIDTVCSIISKHYPDDYLFDYDMWAGIYDYEFDKALETLKVYDPTEIIKNNLSISDDKKLKISIKYLELRRNIDFEICLVLAAIGIKVGGWSKGNSRSWSEEDGETLEQCHFNYDLNNLIYHSSYEFSTVENGDDGYDWDKEIEQSVNYLTPIELGFDPEAQEDFSEIENFLYFMNYNYLSNEIIAEVIANKDPHPYIKYNARIIGTDKYVTSWVYEQDPLEEAFKHSGLIHGKKMEDGNYEWKVILHEKVEDDLRKGTDKLPDEIIVEVTKVADKYIAKLKDKGTDLTDLIDNQAKLKYAHERSGLVKGKKDKDGKYNWRVMK